MNEHSKPHWSTLIKGILFALLFTFIVIVILTVICYFGNISEKLLGFLIFAASAVSVFLSSVITAKKLDKFGFLYGALSGFSYFLIILIASICFSGKFTPSAQSVTMLLGAVLAGALGGIVGINRQ